MGGIDSSSRAANAVALSQSMSWCIGVPWMICFLCYSATHFTVRHDLVKHETTEESQSLMWRDVAVSSSKFRLSWAGTEGGHRQRRRPSFFGAIFLLCAAWQSSPPSVREPPRTSMMGGQSVLSQEHNVLLLAIEK